VSPFRAVRGRVVSVVGRGRVSQKLYFLLKFRPGQEGLSSGGILVCPPFCSADFLDDWISRERRNLFNARFSLAQNCSDFFKATCSWLPAGTTPCRRSPRRTLVLSARISLPANCFIPPWDELLKSPQSIAVVPKGTCPTYAGLVSYGFLATTEVLTPSARRSS
jgi:hypothetical protein